MKFASRALTAGLLVVVLAGCAAERVSGLRPGLSEAGASPNAGAANCTFALEHVDDRRDRSDLGQLGRTVVDGQGFAAWIEEGVAAFPGRRREVPARTLRITLLKAYVQGIGTMKAVNLVVRASLFREGRLWKEVHLRGVDNSINWNNGEGEIQEALRAARADLNTQLASEIATLCSQPAR